MSYPFPFTAVSGQSEFKKALILNAINPLIGGVLVSGPRGCAKSTLARALGQLLPSQQAQLLPAQQTQSLSPQASPLSESERALTQATPSAFVTLPLGASEEMLLGTLDLQQVLNEQTVQFQKGLLAKAHNGVLYVDEVNLLNDALVDLLLDVSASGVNVIERDGISHSHDARFILLGTMNPDEGELRAQLQDRFGLMVKLDNQFSVEERMDIVMLREDYENNPQAFCQRYQAQQQALVARIQKARQLLPHVQCSNEIRKSIALQCMNAQVEGLRSDLVWYRSALSHAAYNGHEQIQQSDVDEVKALVLAHRQNHVDENDSNQNPNNGTGGSNGNDAHEGNQPNSTPPSPPPCQQQGTSHGPNPFTRPRDSYQNNASQPSQAEQGKKQGNSQINDQESQKESEKEIGQWGSMSPEFQSLQDSQQQLVTLSNGFIKKPLLSNSQRQAMDTFANQKGLGAKSVKSANDSGLSTNKPNWFKTLIKNGGLTAGHLKNGASLIFNKHNTANDKLHFILLDTSASTLANQSFAQAKQVIMNLAQQAYLKREKLAIMGFGNAQVKNLLASVRAPKHIREFLEGIGAGGGTPFSEGLEKGQQYLQSLQRKMPALQVCSYVVSDGRVNQHTMPAQASLGRDCVFIDTESSPVKRGRGESIAQQMGAHYLALN